MARFTLSLLVAGVLGGFVSLASAQTFGPEDSLSQKWEQSFLEQAGSQATRIAPGVYQVAQGKSSQAVYTFGVDGLRFNIDKMEQKLVEMKSGKHATSAESMKSVHIVEEYLSDLQLKLGELHLADSAKGTVSSSCSGYNYSMTGYFVPQYYGGYTVAQASIELDGFGPPAPGPASAYALAIAYSSLGEFSSSDSSTQYGSATATAMTSCGYPVFDCDYWEAYVQVYAPSCGYRSYNPSGVL